MNAATILVPGFGDDANFLRSLERALRRHQFEVYTISPQPSNGELPLEALAEQLSAQIVATLPPDQPLNLFGFSMGGLICRTYLQGYGGLARTWRLITLATPHRGTYSAYLFNRPACIQMRPESVFLADLNRDLSPLEQVNFTSIWTPLDLTIVPAVSSLLPVGEMLPIWSPFHRTLTIDPRVVSAILDRLRRPVRQRAPSI